MASTSGVGSFASALFRHYPRRSLFVLLLMGVLSVSEGAGLVLLIPLLALVGLPVDQGAPGVLREGVEGAFVTLGLPLELWTVLGLFLVIMGARSLLRWKTTMEAAALEQGYALHHQQRLYAAILGANWITLFEHGDATWYQSAPAAATPIPVTRDADQKPIRVELAPPSGVAPWSTTGS